MRAILMLAVFGVSTVGATTAQAVPVLITYPFTVTSEFGPLLGVTASGTFTYDTAITPPGGGTLNAVGLLSDLSFIWDGITYNASTANTGYLTLDSSGLFVTGIFGSNCFPGGCGFAIPPAERWAIFVYPNGFADMTYTTSFSTVVGDATGKLGTPTCTNANLGAVPCPSPVPEPHTLPLLGVGLIIGLFRRTVSRNRARRRPRSVG